MERLSKITLALLLLPVIASAQWTVGSRAFSFAPAATVGTPTQTPDTGSYVGTQSVTISTLTGGATLYYCTNASIDCSPVGGTTYSGAISVTTSEHICSYGTAGGYADSAVKCSTYTITAPVDVEVTPTNMTSATVPTPYIVTRSGDWSGTWLGWNAFDGSASTGWGDSIPSATDTNNFPWLKIYLGAAYKVDQYSIALPTGQSLAPVQFYLSGSNDGTSWRTLDLQTSQTGWAAGSSRTFSFTNTSGAYSYYKLTIERESSNPVLIGALHLVGYASSTLGPTDTVVSPSTMTSTTSPSPYVISSSSDVNGSWASWEAFANPFTNNGWGAASASNQWLQVYLGSAAAVTQYIVASTHGQGTTVFPKDWTLQGSNDGTSWTTLDTQTSQSVTEDYQRKHYSFANTTAYSYYRLNVTTNNGGSYIMVGNLILTVAP